MLDNDDLEWFAISTSSNGSGGWLWALFCLVVFVVMAFIVAANEDECAAKHCAHGKGMLIQHECVCVEKPVDNGGEQ